MDQIVDNEKAKYCARLKFYYRFHFLHRSCVWSPVNWRCVKKGWKILEAIKWHGTKKGIWTRTEKKFSSKTFIQFLRLATRSNKRKTVKKKVPNTKGNKIIQSKPTQSRKKNCSLRLGICKTNKNKICVYI